MKAKPLISDAQWRRISPHLAENRCDRAMIEAILYREFSGQSLSEVAEALDVTRVRLHQWHHAIEADGTWRRRWRR